MNEINKFLQTYDNAVSKGDILKISNHFNDQFILSTPTELWHLINNDEFKSNLAISFERYKKLGALECKMLSTNIIEFQSNHCMVDVKWGLIDHKKMPFITFDISYCLKKIDNAWKYIFVIDHNEMNQINLYINNRK